MYQYEWGDFDFNEKFSTWEFGIYTNFIISINVSLLAVYSPMLAVVYIYTCRTVWGWGHVWESNLSSWKSGRKQRKAFDITWPTPNARLIFARNKMKTFVAREHSIQSRSRNYLIYRHPTTFVLERSESWILFLEFFCSTWPIPAI